MWREFDLDSEFVRQAQVVPQPDNTRVTQERISKQPIQTPLPEPARVFGSWVEAPTILTRYEGQREQYAPSRSNLVAQIRRDLSADAPYLSITQCIDLTTELASTLLPTASQTEIRMATRRLLLARHLLYPSVRDFSQSDTVDRSRPTTTGHLEVVVAMPLHQSDGTISVFGTVSAHLDAISEWTLAKGNVLANAPVSLGAMYALGGAESRVIDSRSGVSTVQLEIHRGALLPITQYTAFLSCRTENMSAVDSVTFCT
ncbi:Hypothetical protein, putative [Bodo saltans]|uniref:Uncharacterized protein n=1 Tax=Bodo saltans TaxID=75058 RepID=A0A0S4IPF9_BODSA|nr:Hypothetical protein, putative [Bodo saltans]|eukprot:CUF07524.1 Hypothetical protein, putative [Bodo saltans]